VDAETVVAMLEVERQKERAACAELVRAAGCFCSCSDWASGLDPLEYESAEADEPLRVKVHHPRCPQALAAAIEARG
jgi:hypothetical protein